MLPAFTHPWDLTPADAAALQRTLRGRVEIRPLPPVRTAAALDVSFSKFAKELVGGAVVVDVETGDVLEERVLVGSATFPYVPGLLSFREGPVLSEILMRLKTPVDLILCDGQGLAHPRRFGIACHLGVLFGIPSVGCAKSLLCGDCREPGEKRGSSTRLIHNGDVVGRAVRTRDGVKPVFVSPGHLADFDDSVRLILRLASRYRLPDPIRRAHRLVNEARRRFGL
ncbi:MAG: endonuclease V [Deltaproteobacteria bacterium]|nr:endonuclease V [Deltaproteobacteria bacterium]